MGVMTSPSARSYRRKMLRPPFCRMAWRMEKEGWVGEGFWQKTP